MINLLSLDFLFYFLLFIFSIFLAFYIPGVFFISKLKIPKVPEIILSFILGMTLWGWQGFILGYLQLRWISYIYVVIFLFLWIKQNLPNLQIPRLKIREFDWILIAIFIFGVLMQLTSVWFTGIKTSNGLYFCCGNIADNILMISYTNEISKNFPPLEPGMFPVFIQNYHYWGSLVTGELVRVFRLPLIATNYQYMTVFISVFLGLSALAFSQIVKLKKAFTRWLIFFLYFGGDLIWVLIAIYRGRDFFAMNPMESGQQFLENMPRAMAVVVFFVFLSLFYLWIKKQNKITAILMSIVAATLVGFKIYVGIFALSGLTILAFYFLIKKKFKMLAPIIVTFLFSALIYLPVNNQAGGLYYTGFWRFENFIMQGYFNDLNRMELARLIFVQNRNFLRVIQYELIYASLFLFAIFGTKLLGLIQNRKSLSFLPKEINIILIGGILTSIIPGLFFNQTTGGSNTFNFLVSVFIIGSLYSALVCYYWLGKKSWAVKLTLTVLIISLTIPRSIYQAYNNVSNIFSGKGFYLTKDELKGLDFLSKEKDYSSLVLVDPNNRMDLQSPYISFLSNKKMFLSGQIDELEAHGIDFSGRLRVRNAIFIGDDAGSVSAQLLKYNIGYIYVLPATNLRSTESANYLRTVFLNNDLKIMKVNKKKAQDYLIEHEDI